MKQEGDIGKINKYTNYLLPNKFKRIGLVLYEAHLFHILLLECMLK
jgi:hypothetical protein